jgi:hypothetical protein
VPIFPDVPGPPLNVELVDWDKSFVDLKWEPPASDGGALILKYIVERKVRKSINQQTVRHTF